MADDPTDVSGWTTVGALALLALGGVITYMMMSGAILQSLPLVLVEAAGIMLFARRARKRARDGKIDE